MIRLAAFATPIFMLVLSGIKGKDTGKVSDRFNLIPTPPGPFFAIWGVIYIGLLVSGLYSVINNIWTTEVLILYSIVCILNGIWVYIFSFATVRSINLCTAIVIAMAILNELQWILMEIPSSVEVDSSVRVWNIVNRNIFAFYQGWLVAASNLNLGMTIVHGLGLSKKSHTFLFWIVCPLCICGMVILNLSYSEGFINNIAMYFSAVYALFGAFLSTRRKYKLQANPLSK